MSKNRNYSYQDVDMLMASKTIAESFKANISDLSTTRTDWTEQYANDLISGIDSAIESHLGIDIKKQLRDATASLVAIQVPAKRDLSYFKTQIDDDFKQDSSKKNEILKTLGFSKHLRGVQKGNQESLLQLLYSFKSNMTDTLKNNITSQGMAPVLIDKIISYAVTFKQANTVQENLKETTKEITKDVSDTFNSIYAEVIGICKKASAYYQYEPLKKEQFTFSKAIDNLGAARKVSSDAA
ncbi:MAG: hypothetical protein JXB49_14680 [Bacteroidales bacterium]|nr:hypothetical protein [Bacteroidales bacterium]